MSVSDSVNDQVKAGLRRLIEEKGEAVKLLEPDEWAPDRERVSMYGWQDMEASEHVRPWQRGRSACGWVVPSGALVKEQTYSQFCGTFVDNETEVGINAYGCFCACGRYTEVVLRYVGGLGETIQTLLGYDPTKQMTL